MKKFLLIVFFIALVMVPSIPQIFHSNSGISTSVGTVAKGKLLNGFKMPYRGDNFKYFSLVDYFIFGRCYVHSDIYDIVINSYKELEQYYPDYKFRIMECSSKEGGKTFPHKTHQNGTSIDFMTPLKKGDKVISRYDRIGIWRYLMEFDADGKKRLNKKIEIDFEKVAKHILVLDKFSRQKAYCVKKVILETNLKDELFATKYGEELKNSGIYFVKSLPKRINELHDDHYHIDFEKL